MVLGRYFYPNSARFVAAHAEIGEKRILKIVAASGETLAETPFRKVKITPRLANLPRRLMLPGGACFETLDNDGVDALIGQARHFLGGGWMDRLERSWKAILVSVVLAAGSAAVFVHWGIPAISYHLAVNTPEWLATMVSDQTMTVLEQQYIQPTQLSAAEQAKVQAVFDTVAKSGACGPHVCRLEFRSSKALGANAFALPDGRVVVTDALVHLSFADDELAGVIAHEMSHVRRAHGLTRVYEASLLPAAIVVLTGDLSQVSQISVILPGILIQSAYSRDFESEADADAVATLKKLGKKPAAMADLLERMEKSHCGGHGCGSSWLGDHPDTASRAARFRNGR